MTTHRYLEKGIKTERNDWQKNEQKKLAKNFLYKKIKYEAQLEIDDATQPKMILPEFSIEKTQINSMSLPKVAGH